MLVVVVVVVVVRIGVVVTGKNPCCRLCCSRVAQQDTATTASSSKSEAPLVQEYRQAQKVAVSHQGPSRGRSVESLVMEIKRAGPDIWNVRDSFHLHAICPASSGEGMSRSDQKNLGRPDCTGVIWVPR
jgi:hypothetical protein